MRLRGTIAGEVTLACGRCLERMPFTLRSTLDLVVVAGDEEARRLDAADEPLLVEDGQLHLPEVIEDEVLLAVPLALRHERCAEIRDAGQEKGSSPFAGLKRLLGDH